VEIPGVSVSGLTCWDLPEDAQHGLRFELLRIDSEFPPVGILESTMSNPDGSQFVTLGVRRFAYTTPSAYATGSEVKVSPKVSMYAGELDAEGIIDEEYQAKTKD